MDDGDTTSSWLSDDKRIFIYAIISLALVVGGHRTWQEYHKYHENATRRARVLRIVENSRREKERTDAKLNAASKVQVAEPVASSSSSVHEQEQPDGSFAPATKRSKERRKRGRDMLKEVVKQERRTSKISKQHPQGGKPQTFDDRGASTSTSRPRGISDTRSSSRTSSQAQMSTDYDSTEDTPQPSSWSRLPASSSNATEHPDETMSHLTPRAKLQSDDNVLCDSPTTLAARIRLPDSPEPSTLHHPSTSTAFRNSSSETPLATATTSKTSDSGTPASDTSNLTPDDQTVRAEISTSPYINGDAERSTSSASSTRSHDIISPPLSPSSDRVQISQPTPFAPPVHKHPSWLGNGVPPSIQAPMKSHFKSLSSSSVSSLVMSEASWDNENQASHTHGNTRRGKSPPPRFRSRSRASASPSTLSANPFNSNQTATSSSAHIASYKGALEAARQREEACQRELKRCREECDSLKWRLNEDGVRWRQKEVELQTQIQYLLHQLQALSLASSSQSHLQYLPSHQHQHQHQHQQHQQQQQQLRSPRTLGGFPVMQPVPFGFPPPPIGQHPQLASSNGSPALHAHLPYPYLPSFPGTSAPHMNSRSGSQSSTAASPALDFAPPTYFPGMQHGHNGLNNVNGVNGINSMSGMTTSGSLAASGGAEREDDFNDELAEAILKRPESIRSPTSTSGTSCSGGSRSASVTGRATRDGGFTFPSLSELGNPQHVQQKRNRTTEWAEQSNGDGLEWEGKCPEEVGRAHGEGGGPHDRERGYLEDITPKESIGHVELTNDENSIAPTNAEGTGLQRLQAHCEGSIPDDCEDLSGHSHG